jgi:ketosteroid isomerase-like protein
MNCNIRMLRWICYAIFVSSCQEARQPDASISKEEIMTIVRKNDDKFSEGVKTKNAEFLANIYSDSAQYVQPNRSILDGKDSIRNDWENFIHGKENPIDLILNIHDVRGNREIIYETGDGYTQLADSAKWKFNYVNVWRLQKDGSYKLEVDVYNELK